MEDTFLRKYYSIGKTSVVRRAIREFSQGPGEVFYEAWERLRDLWRQCPHHGIPKHEITQIFYDGLVAPDRYLLDAASGGMTSRFRASLKHKDDGQTKFIKLNSQR